MRDFYRNLMNDIRSRVIVVALWGAFSLGTALYGDFYLSEQATGLLNSAVMLAMIVGQIDVTETCLMEQGMIDRQAVSGRSFFPRVFGLGLLSGIAIFFGLLFLIVPGCF